MKASVLVAALFAAACLCATAIPAPKIVYSCVVENTLSRPLNVEVRYSHPFQNRMITKTAKVPPSTKYTFARETVRGEDDATFAAPVSGVTVSDMERPDLAAAVSEFDVYSPTENYSLRIVPANSEDETVFRLEHPRPAQHKEEI